MNDCGDNSDEAPEICSKFFCRKVVAVLMCVFIFVSLFFQTTCRDERAARASSAAPTVDASK